MLISKDSEFESLKSILSPLFVNKASKKAFNPFKALDYQRVKMRERRRKIDIEKESIKEEEERKERKRDER